VNRDEAFREFVLGQAGSLRRLAYALTGDWHRADDRVQGALERAYVHWHRVAAADELAPIATNPAGSGVGIS